MTIVLCNGVTTLEVILADPERDRMSVLEWDDEGHGCMYQMKISDANAAGFVATVRE